MLPLPRGAVWQTLFLLCAVLFIYEVRSEGRVVCYYTNWSVYRPGTAKFNPQNINPYLCTHLVYAFGGFTKDNQMKPFDKYQDIEQGGYAKFTGLKTYNKQLKTMIAIGGWNEASSRFSPLMANAERRQQFIKNILKFLRQNHFDGIDLDWEYPAQREGGKQRDRDNYAQFVQELRAEFERESQKTGRPRLLLTMAVPAGIENIEKGYDIPKLNKYLDWFNVLSYDFHSSHEPSANHHAPLYSLEEESEYNYDTELNIDYSIKYYLKAGADRDKLVLGIPTYGRSYTLINEESTEIGAPSEGPGEQGDATREKGYLAYYEICQNLKDDPEWTVVQPNPNAMGPYAYRRNQWVGYDDEAIVRKKAQYVVEQGLGGIMFWAIDNDDFRGTCTGKPYPLIESAKDAMLESLGLGINEVAKPSAPKKPSRSRSRENSSSKLNRISGSSEGKATASRTTLSSGRRRIQSTTTTTTQAPETTIRLTNPEGSSLYIGGRVTTPAPPTTPDPGTDFKCEEEGFFQHPRDCKKYYWCLDSGPSGLGIVGHQFTCPSGLYFNPAADSCDFARNVPCKTKKATTAAPVSSTTTTTTTPRSTAALNRITAATARTSFFRTTTTTTPAPEEYEDEEVEEVEDTPAHTKDRDAEEDPQVIKELIELIRKVGGLEELEKHLLRKDDGTISIKGGSSESGVATTPTPISKNLYDKVLSKPNTFNSFRNRFTSSSLFRKSGQTKTEESTSTKLESEESQSTEGASSSGYSKYSSVVRGNSRQGPQNEGLDKLSEFDGFLKEKKQYVTINRHRGAFRGQDDDEDELEEKQTADEVNDNAEEEQLSSRSKTTKRPINTVTPSYASIKRTRPTTLRTESDEEAEGSDEEVKTVKESEEKRTYTSLTRNRSRFTTTESSQPAEEVVTNSNRYKYLDRTRPTSRLQTSFSSQDDDEEDQEDEQNVTVQLNGTALDSTQKSTQTTTRIYANIGRRTTTTTTTTETPTTTQETPTRYNLLENTFNSNNETPEPILPTTTTTVTTPNDSPTLSITIKNTNPQLIPIATTSQPIISTTNAAATTTTANDIELTDTKSIITTLPPNFESDSKNALDLSLDVNSLIEKSVLRPNESPTDIEVSEATTARTTKTATTTTTETQTSTATATTATSTDTDQNTNADEVTNFNNNRTKTQYKFIAKTRNVTKATTATTTTTNTDIDTENENESENNKIFKETKKPSLKTGSSSSTDDKLSSNIRGNTVKYSGGRRQQQTNELLTRKNQIQNQQTDSTTDTTNSITTTEPTPTNEFLGTISSPRPFGYPRRRTRPNNTNPTNNADIQTTTTESSEDEQSILKTRLTATSASKNKVSSNSDVLQVQNGLETNADEGSTTRTPTQTKLHTHTHVVDVVDDVNGVNGVNTNNSLRHVVDRIHSLSINDTLSAQEKSDSRANTAPAAAAKSEFSIKREQLTDTVLENKNRVSVTQLNALTTNTKDETLKTSKYRGKSLATETQSATAESDSHKTADAANFRSRGLKTVSEEKEPVKTTNAGKESISTAESNAANQTTLVSGNSKRNGTSTLTTHANETTITDEGNGMLKIQTVYTTITNTDAADTEQHKANADEKLTAVHSNGNAMSNNKVAKTYTSINRGHAQTHEKQLNKSYNTNDENLGTQNTTTVETQADGSVVRKTVFTTRMKDASGKIITTIVEETLTTRTKIENYVENNSGEGGERKYQTITRHTDNRREPTTETIHYNTIVRGSDGVKLEEDQTSSFYRNIEEVAKQAAQSRSRIYESISRGGKISQTSSEDETASGLVGSEESKSAVNSVTQTTERGTSKYHTINREHTASGLEASTVTTNQRGSSHYSDKTYKNASASLSNEEVSGLEITEAKNVDATSTGNTNKKNKSTKFSGASVDGSLEMENTAIEIKDDEKVSTRFSLAATTGKGYTTTTAEVNTSLPEIESTVIPSAETTTKIPITTIAPEIKETTISPSSEFAINETVTRDRGATPYLVVKSEETSYETARKTRVRPTTTEIPETTTLSETEETTTTGSAESDSAAVKKSTTHHRVETILESTEKHSTEGRQKFRGRPTTTLGPQTATQSPIEETTIVPTESSFKARRRPTTTKIPVTTITPEIKETTLSTSSEASPSSSKETVTRHRGATSYSAVKSEETSYETARKTRVRPTTTEIPETTTLSETEETTTTGSAESDSAAVKKSTTHHRVETILESTEKHSTEGRQKFRGRPTTTLGPQPTTQSPIEETTIVPTESSFKVRGKTTTTPVSQTTTQSAIEETSITSTEASDEVRGRSSTTAAPETTVHQEIEKTTVATTTTAATATTSQSAIEQTTETVSTKAVITSVGTETKDNPEVTSDSLESVSLAETTTSIPSEIQTTAAPETIKSSSSINKMESEVTEKHTAGTSFTARSRVPVTYNLESTTTENDIIAKKTITRDRVSGFIENKEKGSTESLHNVRGKSTTTVAPETTDSTGTKFNIRHRPTTITAQSEAKETTLSALAEGNAVTKKRTFTSQKIDTTAEVIEEDSFALKAKLRGRPTTTESPESTVPSTPLTTILPEISVTTLTTSAESLVVNDIDTTSQGSSSEIQTSTTDSPITTIAPEISEISTSTVTVTTETPTTTESSTIAISAETTTSPVPSSTLAIQTATAHLSESKTTVSVAGTESSKDLLTPIISTTKIEPVVTESVTTIPKKGNNHAFNGASPTKTKVSAKENEATTENVDTQVRGSKSRIQTTRGYVLKNSEHVSSSTIEPTSNRKTTSHRYGANEKSTFTTKQSSRKEESEDREIQSTTETPQRRTTYRGTYRPRMDKDDLSSLLALDVNKHRPYNESQYNLGKRIYLDGIYKGEESSASSGERSSYKTIGSQLGNIKTDAHEATHKVGAYGASAQEISTRTKIVNNRNGTSSHNRRTTVIRRRINGPRNATRINDEAVTDKETNAKLAVGSAKIKTVGSVGENGKSSTTFSSKQTKTERLSQNAAENSNGKNYNEDNAAVTSTYLESLGSATGSAIVGSYTNEDESSTSKDKRLESLGSVTGSASERSSTNEDEFSSSKDQQLEENAAKINIVALDDQNIASDAGNSETTVASHSTKYTSNGLKGKSVASGEGDANVSASSSTANSSHISTLTNNEESVRISENSNVTSGGNTSTQINSSSTPNFRRLSLFAKNRNTLKTETNDATTDNNTDENDSSAQISEATTTKLSGLNKVVSTETISEAREDQTNESNAQELTRSRVAGSRSSNARSRYSGRAQYTNQGSSRNVNRGNATDGYTSKTQYDASGNTRTQTTYTQTYNNGGNTQKTVKRVHTKTVQKVEPEYEVVYEVITEKIPPTTPRPVTRNRGGVRFRDNDLSSLLSLDFAAKSKRRQEGEKTIVKTRRKIIKKPATITENENVEEYEYEEQLGEQQATTRPTRPAATEASAIIRRTRPTRPLPTSTSTTQRVTEAEEDDVAQLETTTASAKPTIRKGFAFKRPISKTLTSTTIITEKPSAEAKTTATEVAIKPTRKGFAFKRPISTLKTTEAPVTTTPTISTEATAASPRPGLRRKLIKIQRPLNKAKVEEGVRAQEAVVQQAAVVNSSETSSKAFTISTTEEPVTTTTFTTDTIEEAPKIVTTATTEKVPITTTTVEAPKAVSTATTEEAPIITTTIYTAESADEPFDLLKKQFSSAITKLRQNDDESVDSKGHTTILTQTTQTTTTTNTVGGETKTVTKTENEVTEQKSVSELNNELNEAGDDVSLSLPIYHRRKYYQYYKDSPVIYIGKPQPSTAAQTSSVDIKKQIHEVFNISNDGNTSFASEELDNNSADVAIYMTGNSETDHFLLKTPGSK